MHPDKAVQSNPQGRKNKEASKKQAQNVAREGYVKCNVCLKVPFDSWPIKEFLITFGSCFYSGINEE